MNIKNRVNNKSNPSVLIAKAQSNTGCVQIFFPFETVAAERKRAVTNIRVKR